jgi:hypothetical protein
MGMYPSLMEGSDGRFPYNFIGPTYINISKKYFVMFIYGGDGKVITSGGRLFYCVGWGSNNHWWKTFLLFYHIYIIIIILTILLLSYRLLFISGDIWLMRREIGNLVSRGFV